MAGVGDDDGHIGQQTPVRCYLQHFDVLRGGDLVRVDRATRRQDTADRQPTDGLGYPPQQVGLILVDGAGGAQHQRFVAAPLPGDLSRPFWVVELRPDVANVPRQLWNSEVERRARHHQHAVEPVKQSEQLLQRWLSMLGQHRVDPGQGAGQQPPNRLGGQPISCPARQPTRR